MHQGCSRARAGDSGETAGGSSVAVAATSAMAQAPPSCRYVATLCALCQHSVPSPNSRSADSGLMCLSRSHASRQACKRSQFMPPVTIQAAPVSSDAHMTHTEARSAQRRDYLDAGHIWPRRQGGIADAGNERASVSLITRGRRGKGRSGDSASCADLIRQSMPITRSDAARVARHRCRRSGG